VHVGWVRIAGLLHEAGLSPLPAETLAVKVEIDTRPPAGARCERRVLTRHLTFFVQHHDLPSLLAGKLHALLARRYAKGRDWYDLLWFRSARPPVEPNLVLLQNALDQTAGPGRYEADSWRALVRRRIESLDAAALAADVRPFLARPRDADLITRENLLGLVSE
jgi:hypothetical protein